MLSWETQSSLGQAHPSYVSKVPFPQAWVCVVKARARNNKATRPTASSGLGWLGRERKKGRGEKKQKPSGKGRVASPHWILLNLFTSNHSNHQIQFTPMSLPQWPGTFPMSSQSYPSESILSLAPAMSILELTPFRGLTKADTAHGISSTRAPAISPSSIITPILHLCSSHTERLPLCQSPVIPGTWGGDAAELTTSGCSLCPILAITYLSPTRQVCPGAPLPSQRPPCTPKQLKPPSEPQNLGNPNSSHH